MPKTDTTVGNLITMIQSGELRLPEMQRRYVWRATRVRDLLDSLYRGYPSGTILVWETDREMPTRDLAVPQDKTPFSGYKLLLDGQQRLTSLSAVLRGEPVTVRGRKRPIDILFNLDHPDGPPTEVLEVDDDTSSNGEDIDDDDTDDGPSIQERMKRLSFVVSSRALAADPHWVKVSDLFRKDVTDAHILKPIVTSFDDPLFDKYSRRLQQLRKIADYPYVMHVLDRTLSYEEVTAIFVRVNSLGVKLRGSDLALALITSRWQDSLRIFEAFQEECEEQWFNLDLGLFVRGLVVFATGQSRFKTVSSIPLDKLRTAWTEAVEGMRFAINFLRSNAGIEDETLLSSPLFAITLAYFAHHKNYRISIDEERGLKHWLYTANAKGHYSRGSTETIQDLDLTTIKRGGGPSELVEVLRQQIGRLEIEPNDLAGRGERGGLFPTAYLALKALGAKDWRTGLKISLSHQGKNHFIEHHHIFPKALLRQAGHDAAEINEIANMAFMTGRTNRKLSSTPPSAYLPDVLKSQGKEALEAHCIPVEPQLWNMEVFGQFLERRRTLLARTINDFIHGAVTASVVNLEVLLATGENERVEFKASARWDYRQQKHNPALEVLISKTIAGFLNAKGGTLVIGVDDKGEVLGLKQDYGTLMRRQDRDGYQQYLVNIISSMLGKEVFGDLEISIREVEGEEVCVIEARPSPRPVYAKEGQQTSFYLRAANTTQPLGVKEAAEYIRKRWAN